MLICLIALGGCMTSVRRIVPSALLDTATSATVRSVRLQSGRQILFRGTGAVVMGTDSGVVVAGDSWRSSGALGEPVTSVVPREQIAEAEIDAAELSLAHTWVASSLAVILLFAVHIGAGR